MTPGNSELSNHRFEGGASTIFFSGDFVLLQKRTADAPVWPSYWGTFGGRIEEGETAREAAAREAFEELGIEVAASDLEKVCEYPIELVDVPGAYYIFAAPLTVGVEDLKLMEGSGFALFSRDEIEGLRLIPASRRALRQFFRSREDRKKKMTGAA